MIRLRSAREDDEELEAADPEGLDGDPPYEDSGEEVAVRE